MRIKCLILLAMLSLVFASVQADLWDPPILNHSFESVENGTPHDELGDYTWGYIIDDWFENEDPDYLACYWQFGSEMGLIADGDMWAGTETGGAFYQAIGTVEDETTYTVTALIGDRNGNSFIIGSFSIYAGGTESDGVDGIGLDSFATFLDSAQVTITSGTLVAANVYEVTVQLDSGVGYAGQTLWLQVRSIAGKDYFDRIEITSSRMASDPMPADGKPLVPVDQVMSWSPPTAYTPLGYNVYFTSDPNLPETAKVIDGENVTSYAPDKTLDFETPYYWRVDPIDPNDGTLTVITGFVWTFTTAPDEPTIITNPSSITIPVGDTAEFTVEDVGGIDYTWYLVAEPEDEEVGDNSPTLSISNVQLADEGYYYCVVSNPNGSETSEQARLMVQRLVGWWKLDGDFTDSVTLEEPTVPVHDGIPIPDPNFTSGIDGMCYEFFGDGQIIEIADSADYFEFFTYGFTVSAWVNDTKPGDWDGLVSKQTECCGAGTGFTLDVNEYNSGEFTVRQVGTAYGGPIVSDGMWHLLTAVYDTSAGAVRLYRDGTMISENTPVPLVAQGAPDAPLVLGAEDALGQVSHTGLLDDVRIWNYPLDPLTIADMYLAVFPDAQVCIEDPAFDYNGNCMVDIDDFASIAAAWLECNMVPESECL